MKYAKFKNCQKIDYFRVYRSRFTGRKYRSIYQSARFTITKKKTTCVCLMTDEGGVLQTKGNETAMVKFENKVVKLPSIYKGGNVSYPQDG